MGPARITKKICAFSSFPVQEACSRCRVFQNSCGILMDKTQCQRKGRVQIIKMEFKMDFSMKGGGLEF